MSLSISLSQTGQVPIHAVLARHLGAFRKMVHFLVSAHRLVKRALDITAGPGD
jgi:hypothetical protein